MKKFVVTALGASLFSLTLATSHAQGPAKGPQEMANAVAAAVCGPGYTVSNITYRDGKPKSYKCSKSIPDQRPCNQNMNKFDSPPAAVGNTLKLSYVCALPEG